MRIVQTQTEIKACLLRCCLISLSPQTDQLKTTLFYKFPSAHDHHEAQPSMGYQSHCLFKVSIFSSQLVIQWGGLPCFLSSSIFDGKFIVLIASICAAKSVMARPQEQRRPWTLEEDNKLKEFKLKFPNESWGKIAELAELDRTDKRCWERWNNYLKPGINKADFSKEDDNIIIHQMSLPQNR